MCVKGCFMVCCCRTEREREREFGMDAQSEEERIGQRNRAKIPHPIAVDEVVQAGGAVVDA